MRNGGYVDSKSIILYYVNDYHKAQIEQIKLKNEGISSILIELEPLSIFEIIDEVSSYLNDNLNAQIYLIKSTDRRDVYNILTKQGFEIKM